MLTEEFQFFHAFLASSMSNNDPAWITTQGVSHQLTKLSANMLKTVILKYRNHLI